MNRKEFLGLWSICLEDAIDELRRVRAGNRLFHKEIRECIKLLEEHHKIDEIYKMLMPCLVNMDRIFEPWNELQDGDDVNERSDDCDSEEENDPQCEHFFKHLKEHNKFYALEYEKDGVHVVHKYGEDSGSDEECSPEPRRKGQRATKQKIVPSNERRLGRSQGRNKIDKMENVKGSPDMVLGRKRKRAVKQKTVPSNERRLTRSQVRNKIDMVENVKESPDMVLRRKPKRATKQKIVPSNQRPLTRSQVTNKVDKVENVSSNKECDPEDGKKANRFQKRKVGPSYQMPDVENQPSDALKMTTRMTRSRAKLANGVEAENVSASPDMVLVSHTGKLNRVAIREVGPSNHLTDVENQREHYRQSNSVKRPNLPTKRKLRNETDKVENTKALPNDMVQDLQHHLLHQNVKFEKDHYGYMHKDKEFEPEVRRGMNVARKQNVGPSNEMPDKLSCSLKKTKCLTKRKVTFAVDKVCKDKDELNVVVLDSRKVCDSERRRELNRATNQKVGPSNQMPDGDKKRKHDLLSCSLKKTKGLTKRKVKLEVDEVYTRGAHNDTVLSSNKERDLQPRRKVDKPTKQGVDLDYDNDTYMHKDNAVVNDEKNHRLNDVKKEREGDIDSDVEILNSEAIIEKGILSNFVPSKRVHYSMEEHRSSEGTEFRQQLLNLLNKPLDKEEYIRHQKAIKRYLGHHPDLRRKLKKYRRNQAKRLTIYRGFFFWLQNLTQEGSFQPWTDCECLAVEPRYL